VIGSLGDYYLHESQSGHGDQVLGQLRAEEANLLHGLDLARADGLWEAAIDCMQGLKFLYDRTGRDGEGARLVADITADVTDPATGGPLPGREAQWGTVTHYRARLAQAARDWPAATALQNALVARSRGSAAEALETPTASLTPVQRNLIRNYGVHLNNLGDMLSQQGDPGCLPHYRESIALAQRLGDQWDEAQRAGNLGNAYVEVPGLRDLDQAEHWYRHGLSRRPDGDRSGRGASLGSLAAVALERFNDARAAGQADQAVLLKHLNDALRGYQEVLALASVDDHDSRGVRENQIGTVYQRAGDTGQALLHYQRAIQHNEARSDIFRAGQTRHNVAILLRRDGRISEALRYARTALDNFRQVGSGAAAEIAQAEQFVADLEQRSD
jgi:tetratricopeptide (TPR) repeat protein